MGLDFYELVEETLLLEDPDNAMFHAKYPSGKPKGMSWTKFQLSPAVYNVEYRDDEAQPFFIYNLNIEGKIKPCFFLATKRGTTHAGLAWSGFEKFNADILHVKQIFITDPETQRTIDEYKKKKIKSITTTQIAPGGYVLAGRVWTLPKHCLISFWSYGTIEEIEMWTQKYIGLLNPKNLPVYVQLPMAESDEWLPYAEFISGTHNTQSSPEVDEIVKQLNDLAPQLHLTTGPVKDKIRKKIEELRKKYKELTGDTAEDYDLRGSVKYGQQAGNKTPASVKAQAQTSESLMPQ